MKLVLFANTDWYLYNFRRSLASALCQSGHEVLLISPPGPYGSELRGLGFRWEPIRMDRRSLNPFRELMLIRDLTRRFKTERPDIIHGFTIKCAVYGSIAARIARVPACVNAVAGLGYVFTSDDAKARLLRPVVSAIMRLALNGKRSRLILQNPDDHALFLEAALVNPERVMVIPGSGVDCARFAPRSGSTSMASGPFKVVLPARLLWDKGIAEYVQAARTLHSEGRNVHFLLAGVPDEGNPASVPRAAVQEWSKTGVVECLGHVDDMPSLFASVHAVVLPSYREGLPKGLIEAAACGLPLIATDVPGCREVVEHGVNGLLVPPKDGAALASAISALHDDRFMCERMGAAARLKALHKFDERIVIGQTLSVYRDLLPEVFTASQVSEFSN
jgi:glycosyltransferase involved in cell wall biosynthesis